MQFYIIQKNCHICFAEHLSHGVFLEQFLVTKSMALPPGVFIVTLIDLSHINETIFSLT